MKNNPAKYFDEILKFLSSDYNRVFTFEEVARKLYPRDFKDMESVKSPFKDDHKKLLFIDLANALMFLNKEGLLYYDLENKTVITSTAGFIKINTEGFSKEIKNKTVNLWLQRGTWVCSIVALFISFYSLSIKNSDESTNSANCNCVLLTNQFGHQQKAKIEVNKSKEILPQKQE